MKRYIFLLLLIIIFVSSCSGNLNYDSRSLVDSADTLASQVDYLIPSMDRTVSLYYQIKNSDYLGVEKRAICFDQESSECNQLISFLMSDPDNDDYKPFNSAFVFDNVENLSSVINVYFRTVNNDYLPYEVYTLAFAVTNTLCDFTGKDYVNVYLDNHSLMYNEHPVGTLVKNQNCIGDELIRIDQMAENNEYYVTLYYSDEDASYVLPEVRLMHFNGTDYCSGIIDELKLGSDNPNCFLSVPTELKVIDEVQDVNDDMLININFNKLPLFLDERKDMSITSICYSVLGFVKEEKMQMNVMGVSVLEKPISKNDYKNYVGQTICIYSINELNSSLFLHQINIMQNELSTLQNVINVFFDDFLDDIGLSVNDIVRKAYYSDEMIVIDFYDCLNKIIDNSAIDGSRLFVYSLVNTLTSLKDVNSVMIIVDGERCTDFAGFINVSEPLLMNPGLIK